MSENLSASRAKAAAPGLLGELQSEVSVEAAPLLRFLAQYAALIMTLLGLFALLVVGVGARQWHVGKRDEEARLELSRLLVQQDNAARAEALERFVERAPDTVRLAALMEFARAALGAEETEKAAAAYGRVAAQDKNGALGAVAALAQAEALERAGKSVDALAVLEGLENIVSETMRPQVRNLLALSAVKAGRIERAVKAYEDLAAGAFGDDAEFYRSRIQELGVSAK